MVQISLDTFSEFMRSSHEKKVQTVNVTDNLSLSYSDFLSVDVKFKAHVEIPREASME